MQRTPQILICDDDSLFQQAVKYALKTKFTVRSAYNGDEALAILRNHSIDVLLLDVQMRSRDEGLRFIPKFREADPDVSIVMSSGLTDFDTVREAMRLGATDYVAKDFDPEELAITLSQVLEKRDLVKRNDQRNFEAKNQQRKHVLVGSGTAVTALKKMIDRMRPSLANVVITGETGTGKEVVARKLRKELSNGLEPFVAVDSATIQSSTAESLLFGHEKGAFTGADRMTKGVFEEANGGIVYFDEIANMPLDIQAKLLRVLQEKEVMRVGSSKPIQLDFRVVCATNRSLEQMVRDGQFKDDLLQRLNVLPIQIPPLRERTEDIPELIQHFARLHSPHPLAFSEDAIEELKQYSWPGNIRELSNVVAYIATMTEGPEVEASDLPPKFRDAARLTARRSSAMSSDPEVGIDISFYERVAGFEKELLGREYVENKANISRMALRLGMDRSHLYTKLREYGIHAKTKSAETRE